MWDRETERQCQGETDIEGGHGFCCFLFQYRANTRRSKTSSYAALAPTLPLLSIGSKVSDSAVPTTPPDPGMAPMLALEPCYSAAHFKRRPSSSILENICSDWFSRNNSTWGFFTVFPLWQLQYSTGAQYCKLHGWENRTHESLCYVCEACLWRSL